MEYCHPLWAYCRGEPARFDKTLERAKQVITGSKTTTIGNNDFKIYGLACFANLTLLSAVRQLGITTYLDRQFYANTCDTVKQDLNAMFAMLVQ